MVKLKIFKYCKKIYTYRKEYLKTVLQNPM